MKALHVLSFSFALSQPNMASARHKPPPFFARGLWRRRERFKQRWWRSHGAGAHADPYARSHANTIAYAHSHIDSHKLGDCGRAL